MSAIAMEGASSKRTRLAASGPAERAPTLEELYRAYASDMYRLAARLLGPRATRADVDDLIQEAFLTADRALPKFRGEGTPYAFIYGVTTRVGLRYLRSRRRYRKMIERYETSEASTLALAPSPEETAAQREKVRRVEQAILRIKPDRRVVFILARLEERTCPEIADALQISEEAVRSRLRRARRDLGRALAEEGA